MVKPLEGDVAAPGNLRPESTHNSAKEWSTLEEMPAEPDVCALTPTAAVLTIASAITRLLNVGTEADAQCQSDAAWEGQPGRGGFEDRGRGHMSRNAGPLDAGKTRNGLSSGVPRKEHSPADTWISAQWARFAL